MGSVHGATTLTPLACRSNTTLLAVYAKERSRFIAAQGFDEQAQIQAFMKPHQYMPV